MGRLVDGQWMVDSVITSDASGRYDRQPRTFRDVIADDHPVYQPESGRYHLYVSYACPWAHRCLIMRSLKDLKRHITVDVVHPDMLEDGWSFDVDEHGYGATGDRVNGLRFLYQVYQKAQKDISTSVTVPVLWDKKNQTIVNNESAEIIRILNSGFNILTGDFQDFYPEDLRQHIDQLNQEIYDNINNGVYRSGFAKNQSAYQEAVRGLFATLDKLENRLQNNTFLLGDKLTEADIRLIPTLIRFDMVYYVHFKCNWRKIGEYKNLQRYARRLFEMPAVAETTHFQHIKRHYYYSHESINPFRIVPVGPQTFF